MIYSEHRAYKAGVTVVNQTVVKEMPVKLYINSFRTFVVLGFSLVLLVAAAPNVNSTAVATNSMMGQPALAHAQPSVAISNVKSYREWKVSMVSEAEVRLKQTRDSIISKRRGAASKDPNAAISTVVEAGLSTDLQTMHNKYEKEQLQLSMAHDLTISDYFVGYLTKQPQLSKAIRDVSGRLSAEEVAELMDAYANNFFTSKPSSTKQTPQAELLDSNGQ